MSTDWNKLEARFDAGPSVLNVKSSAYSNAVAREAAKAHVVKSRALPPSEKQERYLSFLLGSHYGWYGLLVFVRFANGYRSEDEPLTRIHWIEAISLAKDGINSYGTYEQLLALSF